MTQKEFSDILYRYQNNTSSEEERQIVEQWLKAVQHDVHFDLDEASQVLYKQRLWEKVNQQVQLEGQDRVGMLHLSRQAYWNMAKIAAVLVLLVAGVLVVTRNNSTNDPGLLATLAMTNHINETQSPVELLLEDGSSVTLEPGSSLKYSKFTGKKREVYLIGEAFFNIHHDTSRPFLVYANEVVTKVLGTSFIIKSIPGEKNISVIVKTGRVSVTTNSTTTQKAIEYIITPNQQVVFDRTTERAASSLVENPEIVEASPSLKMQYVETSASQILEDMKKTYGIDIQYDPVVLSGCTITVDLSEENLYESLAIVCHTLRATYKTLDTSIVISSNGCNAPTPNVKP